MKAICIISLLGIMTFTNLNYANNSNVQADYAYIKKINNNKCQGGTSFRVKTSKFYEGMKVSSLRITASRNKKRLLELNSKINEVGDAEFCVPWELVKWLNVYLTYSDGDCFGKGIRLIANGLDSLEINDELKFAEVNLKQ